MRWITVAAATLAISAHAATPAPRDAATEIAGYIEQHYVYPDKAKTFADGIRAASDAGDFDALTDPSELAQALTRHLKPLDGHFNVDWEGPRDGPPREPGDGPTPAEEAAYKQELKRKNYFLKRVEILPGNIGLLDMTNFAPIDFEDPDDGARATIDAALTFMSGADAVIIDLRNNGGGAPSMVGYLSSAFVPHGSDIYNTFHTRTGTESEAPGKEYSSPRLDVPVYILTSGRTGSAAEALPYTLQAAKRAIVVGETTGGAANPGGPVHTPLGFRVFISTGAPINPITKTNWEKTGVMPDVAVPQADALNKASELALEAIVAKDMPDDLKAEAKLVLETLKADAVGYQPADYVGVYGDVTVADGEAGLTYTRGRRPAWVLKPVAADAFFVLGEPTRRIVFVREGGAIVALESSAPGGPTAKIRRTS